MKKGWWLPVLVVATVSCLAPSPRSALFQGAPTERPEPGRAALLAGGLRADDARAAALATGVVSRLGAAFEGAALAEIRATVAHLRRLQQAVERRLEARSLVHWSTAAGVATGVLAISGWSRFIDHGRAAPWSRFIEEWEFQIAWRGGWRVIQAAEVPPGGWWQ